MSSAVIDISKVGTYKATVKVVQIKDLHTKIWGLDLEGISGYVKCWKSLASKFGTPLAEGAEAEAEIEVKTENYQGQDQLVVWLNSFGGSSGGRSNGYGGNRSGGGYGGGKSSYQPKTTEEIHSASICGCVKSALEFCAATGVKDEPMLARHMDLAVAGYLRGISKIKGAA